MYKCFKSHLNRLAVTLCTFAATTRIIKRQYYIYNICTTTTSSLHSRLIIPLRHHKCNATNNSDVHYECVRQFSASLLRMPAGDTENTRRRMLLLFESLVSWYATPCGTKTEIQAICFCCLCVFGFCYCSCLCY